MSRTTSGSDDYLLSNNLSESPAADVGSGCGSRWDASILKKGPWTSAEDAVLIEYVKKYGEGNWNAVQKHTGLSRCGKSCRLRWANHLRPNLKKGAFSQEEEQLIIELHAKMGNKWARMAAHLPGRTDNEIKNYWNTRIKRRQRAGLPLYPPEMHVQALQRNLDCGQSETMGTDERHQDFLRVASCDPSVFFDNLKVVSGVVPSAAADLSDMSACNMMDGGSSSQYKSFMPPITHCRKRLRGSGTLFPGCGNGLKDEFPSSLEHLQHRAPQKISRSLSFSFPYDIDLRDTSQHSSGMSLGSHTLMNGIVPTSKPTFGTVKLELPSFQYPETNFDQWNGQSSPPLGLFESVDVYIQSPPATGKMESDCFSSSDSGLLDMLLHEAKIRSSTKNNLQSSEKSLSSSTLGDKAEDMSLGVPETKFKEHEEDPPRSLVLSEIPTFSEGMQLCTGVCSLGESPCLTNALTGDNLKSESFDGIWTIKKEKESMPITGITRPDVLLASSWFEPSSIVQEKTTMSDALAAVLGDDIGNDYVNMGGGGTSSSSSSPGQARGLGSCAWSNMPPVCQITELP